jgi:hypothetical protein
MINGNKRETEIELQQNKSLHLLIEPRHTHRSTAVNRNIISRHGCECAAFDMTVSGCNDWSFLLGKLSSVSTGTASVPPTDMKEKALARQGVNF